MRLRSSGGSVKIRQGRAGEKELDAICALVKISQSYNSMGGCRRPYTQQARGVSAIFVRLFVSLNTVRTGEKSEVSLS